MSEMRFQNEDVLVDTCAVSDGFKLYETAVGHYLYNDGSLIIVGAYETRLEAIAGHAYWVRTMTDNPLPPFLRVCTNDILNSLAIAIDGETKYYKKEI
jgi:hypothetical protein